MQLFLVFYKLNCCGWWPSLPGPRDEQSVLRAWCPCYVCDALGATAYHHPASWRVPLQMWLPAVLPNWRWWDKGMEVANKDWREDVTPAALLFIRRGSSSWWAIEAGEIWDPWPRDGTHIPWFARQILSHWTKEVPVVLFKMSNCTC